MGKSTGYSNAFPNPAAPNRRDIADYLGIALETVSRAFSILRDEALVRFDGSTHRRLELLDRHALAEFDV